MRTLNGNKVDLVRGFTATVKESSVDFDENLLEIARRDIQKYYPVEDEFDNAQAELVVEEAIPAEEEAQPVMVEEAPVAPAPIPAPIPAPVVEEVAPVTEPAPIEEPVMEEPAPAPVVEVVEEPAPAEEVAEEYAVTEEPAMEEPAPVVEEVAVMDATAEAMEIEVPVVTDKPKYRPSPTFAEKMMRADELLQDRYDELKNYVLRYKKIKTRISKKFDSFNQGRLQFVKLSVAGKTLKLYLNMDINECDPKFHCKDVSDKKTYVDVPVLLRVKSGRAVRYAKMLIDQCAEKYEFKENNKFMEVDAIGMIEQFLQAKEEASAEQE
ncbi:MAG: hypothetical protein MJ072_04230 [Clostridia bacterium]|nr:hypothetical protein [Clostridia bacterium]